MAGAPDWIQAIGSVLAILLAAAAIFLQSRELREQRKELSEQRRELSLQRQQLELQRLELARNVAAQERIAATAEDQHYLDLQIRLLLLTFEHEELGPLMGVPGTTGDRTDWMRFLYMTAWMRLFESGLALGLMAPETLEVELRESFFASDAGITWWRSSEYAWRADAELGPRRGGARDDFIDLIERLCQEAEARPGSARPGED